MASLSACAGFYVAAYCSARSLPTAGIRLVQRSESDPKTKLPTRIAIEIELPAGFPAGHRDALVRAAGACKVKKTLAAPPIIDVHV